jgi:cytosine/adenosine deaminase-related metal-dependent hydrolase
MIVRAPVVVTMDGAPIENGAVAISGDRIAAVGTFDELTRAHGGEVVDLEGHALLPGLINAHCHFDYTSLRGKIPRRRSFADWIRAINAEKAKLSPDDYVASIHAGFREARTFGTTSIVNLTAFPELISRIDDPLRTWWCAELIDVRPGTDPGDLVASARRALDQTRSPLAQRGFAPHAPYTASPELYRAVERTGSADGLLRITHLAESFEELQMFRYASGGLYDFLASIGRDMFDCGIETPVTRVLDLCPPKSRWLFAHLNELMDDDVARVERAGPLNVVHCPRSHSYFQHTAFAYERLRDARANICLGTDSLASAPDLNLFAEMREFRRLRAHVSARETLEMVTVNAAAALGKSGQLGRLAAGYLADLVALPFSGAIHEVYETVVAFDEPVGWMMVNGALLGNS